MLGRGRLTRGKRKTLQIPLDTRKRSRGLLGLGWDVLLELILPFLGAHECDKVLRTCSLFYHRRNEVLLCNYWIGQEFVLSLDESDRPWIKNLRLIESELLLNSRGIGMSFENTLNVINLCLITSFLSIRTKGVVVHQLPNTLRRVDISTRFIVTTSGRNYEQAASPNSVPKYFIDLINNCFPASVECIEVNGQIVRPAELYIAP